MPLSQLPSAIFAVLRFWRIALRNVARARQSEITFGKRYIISGRRKQGKQKGRAAIATRPLKWESDYFFLAGLVAQQASPLPLAQHSSVLAFPCGQVAWLWPVVVEQALKAKTAVRTVRMYFIR
jgi:hypothetical protein